MGRLDQKFSRPVLSGMNTISFQDCERKQPKETFFLVRLDDKPTGLELEFNKGLDDRTRQPLRYKLLLTPATRSGTWENAAASGDIEHVERKDIGTEHIVNGIWVEAGERSMIEIYFAK
jgi:hypothetical protein